MNSRYYAYGICILFIIFLNIAFNTSIHTWGKRIFITKIEHISYSRMSLMEEEPASFSNKPTGLNCDSGQCNLDDLFAKRRLILALACENIDIISKMKISSTLEELINFHSKIYNLDYNYFKKLKHRNL